MTKLLFLCVANSARSQIAEALAKTMLPLTVDVKSAGSKPGARVHPEAIETMAEVGIDIASARPKAIEDLPDGFLSQDCLVVRLCAEEECPFVSGVKVVNWNLTDPASVVGLQQKFAFIQTRETLRELIPLLNLDHIKEEKL